MYVRSSGFYPDTFGKCASCQARVSFLLRSLAPNLIRVQNIVHCVGCHPTKGHDVNLTLRVYFAPTNFTLSAYLASKHFGDSACFGSKNLRDSAPIKLHFYDVLYVKTELLHFSCKKFVYTNKKL